MRLIITGCGYTGKSTLLRKIQQWCRVNMGDETGGHDHFGFPGKEMPGDEGQRLLNLGPKGKQMFQLYMMEYHVRRVFFRRNHHILVGYHFQEAIYAPLYYGYTPATRMIQDLEREIMEAAPDMTLVQMKASPEVIRERMKADPHPNIPLKPKDVELVLEKFEAEYQATMLRRKFVLDSTDSSPDRTFAGFLEQMERHFTDGDRMRILTHRALEKG